MEERTGRQFEYNGKPRRNGGLLVVGEIIGTDAAVIDGQVYNIRVVSVKDTAKGSAVKPRIGIINIRCNNSSYVSQPGKINIRLKACIAILVIRICRKVIEVL